MKARVNNDKQNQPGQSKQTKKKKHSSAMEAGEKWQNAVEREKPEHPREDTLPGND